MSVLTSAPDQTHLPRIRALRLEIRTKWARPTIIPGPIIANVLRGALGITLRRLVCPQEWLDHECPPCPLYPSCAYGQVFAPTPPAHATQLRLQQDLPRPFVIEPPGLDPDEHVTPEGITFRLVLFGTACEALPFLVTTLDRLGHDGMGPQRVPFTIEQITACHPAGDEVLYTGGSTSVALPQRRITTEDLINARPQTLSGAASSIHVICDPALPTRSTPANPASSPLSLEGSCSLEGGCSSAPPLSKGGQVGWGEASLGHDCILTHPRPRITLHFLTPLLLKTGSGINAQGRRIPAQEIRDRPPFGVIIRRLRDRVSALSLFFGDPWQHPDFASLGTLADTVTLIDSRTVWLTRGRRSTRTGAQHELSGLIGQATYEFPDTSTRDTLLPLLKLGELLHVGKNAPWGNGGMRVDLMDGGSR